MGQCTRFFFGVFTHFLKFSRHAWEKIPKMLVFTRVYVCVKAKVTLVSFPPFLYLSLTGFLTAFTTGDTTGVNGVTIKLPGLHAQISFANAFYLIAYNYEQ